MINQAYALPPKNLIKSVRDVFEIKGGTSGDAGWAPRLREAFDYYTPDEYYEAQLLELIGKHTEWLDVGCGHNVFPSNEPLAKLLSGRCQVLVGVDPSENIDRNKFVHKRAKCMLEQFETEQKFDLISLRMVAEHIGNPGAAIAALDRLTKGGGRVVIYTVSRWSLSSIIAAATPIWLHHFVKRLLWGSASEDTFPTVYQMNTRNKLRELFEAGRFKEESFFYLNDCRSFERWRTSLRAELMLERTMRHLRLRYFDVCLLGVYQKVA